MEDAKFRSVYLPVVRDEEPRSLEVFDFADSSSVIGTRESSNTPNQALYMMNNRFVIQQSEIVCTGVSLATESNVLQIKLKPRSCSPLADHRPPANGRRRLRSSRTSRPTASYRSRNTETLSRTLSKSVCFRRVSLHRLKRRTKSFSTSSEMKLAFIVEPGSRRRRPNTGKTTPWATG